MLCQLLLQSWSLRLVLNVLQPLLFITMIAQQLESNWNDQPRPFRKYKGEAAITDNCTKSELDSSKVTSERMGIKDNDNSETH